MSEQTGRVVVITGGGSGMGRACAAAFAGAGAEVAILGRTEETLRAAAQEIGQRVWWIQADVSRRDDVERAVAALLARHGQVDVLVNAAGFARGVAADTPLDAA
ncbi:MAG TPA: SDR family NAD(P)-dependent oxidoreductase, partial [Ktedonobacterales bacterium]|nr:SDR family NAD(P)-dependent oxidoreductase [Ktedonobacterales bacterium]